MVPAAGIGGTGSPSPDDLAALAGGLARLTDGTGAASTVVELSAGPAVRLRRRGSAEGPDARVVEVEMLQYFVVVPGAARLLLLTFSTPNVALADALVELFDAIASTLRWRW